MDARITKTRLSNLLSYDWLKIIVVAVAAIFALCVIFPMVQTRAKDEQVFTVYGYTDLFAGADLLRIEDEMLEKGVFSYEILDTHAEQITEATGGMNGGAFGGAVYATRLINDSRTVMFVSSLNDPKSSGYSAIKDLIGVNRESEGSAKNGFLDFKEYLSDCEQYLKGFFGENWREGALDEQKAESCFYARNSKDKRFKKEAQIQQGIEREKERLKKLRKDYIAVLEAFDTELLSYSTITVTEEDAKISEIAAGSYVCGVSVGKLAGLRNLYYYTEEVEGGKVSTVKNMSMIVFNSAALGNKENDLRYETVSFLNYLIVKYGAKS